MLRSSLLAHVLCGVCAFWHLFTLVRALEVPPIACPNYFEYLNFGNQYIGKITLPNAPVGTVVVDVAFSQRVPVESNYFGRLTLFSDQATTIRNLQNGLPISYRVDFPFPNVLPKLTKIAVNDLIICFASDYPAPSTMLKLQHTLTTTTTTIRNGVVDSRPLQTTDNFISPPAFGPTFPNRQNSYPNSDFPPTGPQGNPFIPQVQNNQHRVNTQQQPTPAPTPAPPPAPPALPIDANAVCGREGGSFSPFIHGGKVLSRGQIPWLTAIYQKQSEGLKFICGGSLVSARTVLSAAHCFKVPNLTADRIVVYLGRYNLENYSEDGIEPREIRTLIINPEYDSSTYPDADLAILQMKVAVTFTQYIRPICLWSEATEARLIVGQKGYIAGWGADENGRSVSPLPKMVDSNIVSESDCLRSEDGFKELTSPRTLCAGNRDGTGPCMGDSGGGLMLNRNGRWMLRGVVSAGQTVQQRCNLQEYVIYCDLAQHITWVRTNVI